MCVCVCLYLYLREKVMGLLLLCGIRCALFVCFVSVGEAGPSQNVGSVSGSVRILQTFLDMVNLALNFCVHLSLYSLHWWICSVCQSTSLFVSFSLKCGISVSSCSHHRLGVCFSLSKGKRYLLLTFITYLEYFFFLQQYLNYNNSITNE